MTNNTTKGVKKSSFTGLTSIPSGAYLDFVSGNQNYRILDTDFYASLGVTGTIVQDGDPLGTPVLDQQGSVNAIRNITGGFGVNASINAQNGIDLSIDYNFDTTGAVLVDDVLSATADFRSIVGGTGVQVLADTGTITINSNSADSMVIVKEPAQLAGALLNTVVYYIDGTIDMTGFPPIVIPATGVTFVGNDFRVSKIISATPNATIFTGSGNLQFSEVTLTNSGAGSKMFNLTGATGAESLAFLRVEFRGSVSLGEVTNYNQGLESNTRRIGGNPSLTLSGAWSGYRISTSLVRGLSNSVATPLFKAGAGLVMSGRYLSDVNADLGTLAALTDFIPANFANSSSFKLTDTLILRNGVLNDDHPSVNTGLTANSLASNWKLNSGLNNTYEGGRLDITTTIVTALSGVATGTYLDAAGTVTPSDLTHFDAPANGQIRFLGSSVRDFTSIINVQVLGTAGDVISLRLVKWDDSAASFVTIATQDREVFNFTGGADYGFFSAQYGLDLDTNDYLKLMLANTTAARNVTVQLSDYLIVQER